MPKIKDTGGVTQRLADRVDAISREVLEDVIDVAIRETNRRFRAAPPQGASQDEWHMAPIIESQTKRWDGDGWVAEWTHPATSFIEYGVRAHEIEGDPVLSFRWENPPEGIADRFAQARDEQGQFAEGRRVFLARVDHPGIPALGAIRGGAREALNAFSQLDPEGL